MSTLTGASVNGWLLYRAAALRDLGYNIAGCNPKTVNLYLGEQWNCLPEKERRVWRRRPKQPRGAGGVDPSVQTCRRKDERRSEACGSWTG